MTIFKSWAEAALLASPAEWEELAPYAAWAQEQANEEQAAWEREQALLAEWEDARAKWRIAEANRDQ